MGFLSGIVDSFTGKSGASAFGKAGRLQSGAIKEAAGLTADSQDEIRLLIEEQLGITRDQFAPFLEAGTDAIGGAQEASTIGGLDSRIAEILGSESFQPLVEERTRGIEGLLGAGGLTRSGAAITEGANIGTDLAFEIENLLSGRESNLANTGFSATTSAASADTNFLQDLINSITNKASAQSSGITGSARATASGILGAESSRAAGTQNLLNLGGQIGSAIFSDPRLKENIVKIGRIGELNIYQWDYIDEIKESKLAIMNSGFLTTEVKEVYPEHVHELAGYDLIDYSAVLNEIEANGIN